MRMYPFIVLASFGALGAFLPNLGRAEGGSCPPGFYPIGGQGASGCAQFLVALLDQVTRYPCRLGPQANGSALGER